MSKISQEFANDLSEGIITSVEQRVISSKFGIK
jgi:hypothetical protein